MSSSIKFRYAEWKDVDRLLEMMRDLYAHDGTNFDEATSREATNELISSMDSAITDFGRIWLIERNGEVVGYIVLTFGFSLEYGGMHGFIDELFVQEGFRGEGAGSQAIEYAAAMCKHLGMSTLLLEVDLENARSRALYERIGFREHRRRLMSRVIGAT
jgi:ribosomal protein S18 acetylase RimI-like enzyme